MFSLGNQFPLLTKELVEQSARWRTYAMRVLFAGIVIITVGFANYELFRRGYVDSNVMVDGQGIEIFQALLAAEFVCIILFLPAMISGVVIKEKENETLTLLLLTELKPWEIVAQKLGGRVIAMLSYALTGMPLLAVAYAYGGVSANHLWAAVYLMFVMMLQVGSIAIMFSSYCRTQNTVMLSSYLMGPVLYFASFVLVMIVGLVGYLVMAVVLAPFGGASSIVPGNDVWLGVFPPLVIGMQPTDGWYWIVLYSLPSILVSGFWCKLAVDYMMVRSVKPTKYLVTIGSSLNGEVEEVGWVDPEIGAVTKVRRRGDLPEYEPVDWLERTRRTFADRKSQMGLMSYIAVVFGLFELLFAADKSGGLMVGLSVILGMKYLLMCVIISFAAVSLYQHERMGQTLDVLLSTPMTAYEILWQKMSFLRGWLMSAWIIMLPTIVLQAIHVLRGEVDDGNLGIAFCYVLLSVCMVSVYLRALLWFSTWFGLRTQERSKQIVFLIVVLMGLMFVPEVIYTGVVAVFPELEGVGRVVLMGVSPMSMFINVEGLSSFNSDNISSVVLGWGINMVVFWGVYYYFKQLCTKHVDDYMYR